ncbi:DUF7527 domain-containing protein [Natronomonas amylolytica]|uniref:DUF7527 domain-containing protein n=1 Tax=Natronomonas amylolytica TaxID=3108498 RepID=UPI0030088091
MDAHTVMEKWEGSPFDGGFDGLRDLQSRGFSGAVEAGDSRLFLRDGEPLAVVSNFEEAPREGSIETFEDAVGQAHEAGHPGTVPLAAMLALDGEVRGRYFSDDTPLSDVHETLSGGGFTGYVELSENVLSGDYYIVYRNGDADYIGYISSSGRLISDEEAQEKAEGEIGIYEVVAVSLSDIEIPAAPEPDTGTGAVGVASESPSASDTATDVGPEAATDADSGAEMTPEPETEPGVASEPEPSAEPATEPEPTVESEPETEPATEPEPATESGPATEPKPEQTTESETAPTTGPAAETADESEEPVDSSPVPPTADGPSEAAGVSEPEPAPSSAEPSEPATETDGRSTSEPSAEADDAASAGSSAAWQSTGPAETSQSTAETSADPTGSVMDDLTTRSVPSIDPENTGRGENGTTDGTARGGAVGATSAERDRTQAPEPEPEPEPTPEPESSESSGSEPAAGSEPDVEARIEEVREEYESELESLRAELDSLRAERDRLQERVETLQQETAGAGGGGVSLTPERALTGTSLFVRDEGPGGPTLEDAHAGSVEPEELAENLRIEYHTQFEDEDATVDGEPFESFLRSSPLYAFTEWVLTDLLFEIQSTRSEGAMRPLYDALPEIDRVSFGEPVTVGEGDDQQDIEFDVVARDRMGDPLVAANMDESRDPTRAASLEPLIDDASDVAMEADRFAGAFAVTSSYFEPDALEAAREATSGSLLSREKYRNFVKLSRNNGFHLCLVESRDESFHMTMPEL